MKTSFNFTPFASHLKPILSPCHSYSSVVRNKKWTACNCNESCCQQKFHSHTSILLDRNRGIDNSPISKTLPGRMSGTVSGPWTVFNHKQLCRRFVLGSTAKQPSYPNPTWLRSTPQTLGVLESVESKSWSSRYFTTRATHLSCRCSCLLNNNNNVNNNNINNNNQQQQCQRCA